MVTCRTPRGALEAGHRHEVPRTEPWGTGSVRVRAAQHRVPVFTPADAGVPFPRRINARAPGTHRPHHR